MKAYKKIERFSLGFFPTPLTELSKLSDYLNGPRIFIKRDDQTGLAFGGNKTRKLEYLMADALSKGADTIITGGASQSNHCRQTAAAAVSCNMECHLVLGGSAPQFSNGNLLLDQLLNAKIHWAGEHRKGESIPQIVEQLVSTGKKPYIIPYGGSNEIGATGFVEAIREIDSQEEEMSDEITHIVFASSSGGTQAGLIVGSKIYEKNYKIIGVNIDKDKPGDMSFEEYVLDLANKTAGYLDTSFTISNEDLLLNSNYIGEGYGILGDLEREGISLTAKLEGILLDPVYTGRAMGALIDMIRKKEITDKDTVVFWHTGGTPALFAYAEDFKYIIE